MKSGPLADLVWVRASVCERPPSDDFYVQCALVSRYLEWKILKDLWSLELSKHHGTLQLCHIKWAAYAFLAKQTNSINEKVMRWWTNNDSKIIYRIMNFFKYYFPVSSVDKERGLYLPNGTDGGWTLLCCLYLFACKWGGLSASLCLVEA